MGFRGIFRERRDLCVFVSRARDTNLLKKIQSIGCFTWPASIHGHRWLFNKGYSLRLFSSAVLLLRRSKPLPRTARNDVIGEKVPEFWLAGDNKAM